MSYQDGRYLVQVATIWPLLNWPRAPSHARSTRTRNSRITRRSRSRTTGTREGQAGKSMDAHRRNAHTTRILPQECGEHLHRIVCRRALHFVMAQFDRYRRRVVVPLVRQTLLPRNTPTVGARMNPVFVIQGARVVLHPLDMVSVALDHLGDAVGSLAQEGRVIADALDDMLTRSRGGWTVRQPWSGTTGARGAVQEKSPATTASALGVGGDRRQAPGVGGDEIMDVMADSVYC